MSPEPKQRSRAAAREGSREAGRARVKRELLAETNGPHTTSELLFFALLAFLYFVPKYQDFFFDLPLSV